MTQQHNPPLTKAGKRQIKREKGDQELNGKRQNEKTKTKEKKAGKWDTENGKKSMTAGCHPVDFNATVDDLRLGLEDMGEKILGDTHAVMPHNTVSKEFEFIKKIRPRDPSFNLEQIKQTAVNFHIDDLCRIPSAPSIFWRGAAKTHA